MIDARRATLAAVFAAGLIGVALRMGPGSSKPVQSFDFASHRAATVGEKLGPFTLEATIIRAGLALQLRALGCVSPLFMGISSVIDPVPAALVALRYPPAAWRTLYVYRGRTSDTFAPFPAHVRFLALGVLAVLTSSSRDPSDGVYFTFHTPVDCSLDQAEAVTAADSALVLARSIRH